MGSQRSRTAQLVPASPAIPSKDLGVFFEAFLDSEMTDEHWNIEELHKATKAMRFPQLETFHLAFNFDVFGLPSFVPGVS